MYFHRNKRGRPFTFAFICQLLLSTYVKVIFVYILGFITDVKTEQIRCLKSKISQDRGEC